MLTKNPLNPAERVLAWLDEGPEIENYATHEIEGLPLGEVDRRLEKLGVDSSLPGYIKRLAINEGSPAQTVLDLLDDKVDRLSPEEIEQLAPGDVATQLNSLGLNYRSGVNEIVELMEARFNEDKDRKLAGKQHWYTAWTRLKIEVLAALKNILEVIGIAKMAGLAAVVTAALACVFVVSHWTLEGKRAQSEQEQLISHNHAAGLRLQPAHSSNSGATVGQSSVDAKTTLTSLNGRDVPGERQVARGLQMARWVSGAVAQPITEQRAIAFNSMFVFGSAEITPEGSQKLHDLGNALNHELADQKAFLIEGDTDRKEDHPYDSDLSQRRAEAVKAYLVRETGVSPERLRTVAKGFSEPADPKNPNAADNRRVMIINLGE
jgi:outer membrane protein OmpA-like peptidoglycan-associated protein